MGRGPRKHGNCRACGTQLDEQGFCWKCSGDDPEAALAAPPRKALKAAYDSRCQGYGEKGRCQLVATAKLDGHGWFCGWHFACRCTGWEGHDYQEFEKFMAKEELYERQFGNPSPWRSHTIGYWWDCVNGRDPKPEPARGEPRTLDRLCTREENLAAIREIRKMLAGKGKAPMAQALREVLDEVPF